MSLVVPEMLPIPGEVPVLQFFEGGRKGRLLDAVFDRSPLPDDALLKTFVPSWEAIEDEVVWDTPFAGLVRDVLIRLEGGIPSRYEGVPGVGKTEAVKVACAIKGLRYNRHNYSPESDPGDTIGRFIPTDPTEAIKWEDITKMRKDVQNETIQILTRWRDECARYGQRPLSPLEIVMILKAEKLTELLDFNKWKFQKGSLYFCMEQGVVFAADEPNFARGAVLERENPALEEHPILRIPEHENEIIRELTPEERSLVAAGVAIPNVIDLKEGYCYQASQNPWGIGGDRREESPARRNRLSDRLVERLTAKEYEEFLRQKILGIQPDIEHKGKTYKGARVKNPRYKEFQDLPNASVVIKWLAKSLTDFEKLTELGKIGSEKDTKGGSYTWSRRNLVNFLKEMKSVRKCLVDTTALFATGETRYNNNWHDALMEAFDQEFLKGMYEEDRRAIEEIIKKTGIEDYLGPSINHPKQPEWVTKAQAKGVKVQPGSGKYTISKLELSSAGFSLEEFKTDIAAEDYRIDDESGDNIIFHRHLKSIQTVWVELYGEGTPEIPEVKLVTDPNEDMAK